MNGPQTVSLPAPTPATNPLKDQTGFKAGFGGSAYYGSNASGSNLILGFAAGGFYRITINPDMRFQLELLYEGVGARNSYVNHLDQLDYLQLPLSLMARIHGENYYYGGIAPALFLRGTRTLQDNTVGNLTGVAPFEFSVFLGAQVMLGPVAGKDVFLDARGQLGLTSLDTYNLVDIKNISFLISLGYSLK